MLSRLLIGLQTLYRWAYSPKAQPMRPSRVMEPVCQQIADGL